MAYKTILADPPWAMAMAGKRKRGGRVFAETLPYESMTHADICNLPIRDFADDDCHLWLWTTNSHLQAGFEVMGCWGFKYLAPVHWLKPSGTGNWFIHRTQTLLFGYRKFCKFPLQRYKPNFFISTIPKRHSQKPAESYQLIESISPGARLELFARAKRDGWDAWGNEVTNDVEIAA